jgi:hypothetical protein
MMPWDFVTFWNVSSHVTWNTLLSEVKVSSRYEASRWKKECFIRIDYLLNCMGVICFSRLTLHLELDCSSRYWTLNHYNWTVQIGTEHWITTKHISRAWVTIPRAWIGSRTLQLTARASLSSWPAPTDCSESGHSLLTVSRPVCLSEREK